MPIIQIDLLAGRSAEQKASLIKDVTDAVVRNTGATKENVHIIIRDMAKENYGTGGQTKN